MLMALRAHDAQLRVLNLQVPLFFGGHQVGSVCRIRLRFHSAFRRVCIYEPCMDDVLLQQAPHKDRHILHQAGICEIRRWSSKVCTWLRLVCIQPRIQRTAFDAHHRWSSLVLAAADEQHCT